MEQRFDKPALPSFEWSGGDQEEKRRFMLEVAAFIRRYHDREGTPPGVQAIGLAEMSADLLRANYPEQFRKMLASEIYRQLFEMQPPLYAPRLIRLVH